MSRILFGQSYYMSFDPKLQAAMQPYPPLGTLYAAASVRAKGYGVALFDAMLAGSEQEWESALEEARPRYAVLFEDNFNYLSKMCLLRMRDAAFRMISVAKARGCTVILCGADATDHAGDYLAQGADYVLIGEGELTLVELLESLDSRSRCVPEKIFGIAWRDVSGEKRRSPPRSHITQLDSLPFPAWDLIDVPRYRSAWKKRHGFYSMNMVTTRGCPYHCNWCAKPIWGQRYNSRSPENVLKELEWLGNNYRPDHIWFADDIFGLQPGWVERFGELVHQRGVSIPFKCQMRADLVKAPVVEGLRRAGCETVWIGAESGSQKILDAMEKGTTVEQIAEARRRLGEADIMVGFFLQFGYPGETRADVEQTLRMVRDLMPDDIGISVSYPLPGTKFHDRVRSQLGDKRNWIDSDDLAILHTAPFPESFYRTLYRAAHSEFRVRKALGALKNNLKLRQGAPWLKLASVPRHWLEWQIQRRRLWR